MSGETFRPDLDEPAVRNPLLLEMVQSVRAEPEPATKAELGSIQRQIDASGRGFRTGVAAGVLLAAAAGVAFWLMQPAASVTPAAVESPVAVAETDLPGPGTTATVPIVVPTEAAPVALADAVRITSEGGAPPRALGAMDVRLAEGRYEIELAAVAGGELTVRVLDRVVALEQGRLIVDARTGAPVVTLERGVAAWVAEDGTRTPITIEAEPVVKAVAPAKARTVSPAELAAQAEQLLADGERKQAMVVLRNLATRHPNSAAGKTALLDLGRELSRQGLKDDARCAYESYLERYPKGQLRAEVERKLDKLGEGRGCRGLDPK